MNFTAVLGMKIANPEKIASGRETFATGRLAGLFCCYGPDGP